MKKDPTPLERIDFGAPVAGLPFQEMLYEIREHPVFLGILQYLRDEAYARLSETLKQQRAGKPGESALALGAFDGLSQVIVKLKYNSEMAPPVEG